MSVRSKAIGLITCGVVAVGSLSAVATAQSRSGGYSYQSGQELYERICQGCHMAGGEGAAGAGAYPPLAGNRKLQTPLYTAIVILRGQKAMPSFSQLNDAQVAAVTNYVRTSFGNAFAGEVTVEQVQRLRPRAIEQNAQRPG
jgi:mono/diheme cytochrome c family protein